MMEGAATMLMLGSFSRTAACSKGTGKVKCASPVRIMAERALLSTTGTHLMASTLGRPGRQ